MKPKDVSQVFLAGSSDRDTAVRALFTKAGPGDLSSKRVVLKANFNSADPFPASTHLDTVRAIVKLLKEAGSQEITLVERSGMGDTRDNLERLGVFTLAKEMGFGVIVLDEQPVERWAHVGPGGTHWQRGFYLSKVVLEADVVVQTCCLKTHGYGGHFTMSLKNSVGLVARKLPGDEYDYMHELHGSPFQRLMIAEINAAYSVDLVIMDAAKAFIEGGPDKGTEVEPGLMLAAKDRVALDAAGAAVLRGSGASSLKGGPVFGLEQIRRAAELGVGAGSAAEVQLTSLDEQSRAAADSIRTALAQD